MANPETQSNETNPHKNPSINQPDGIGAEEEQSLSEDVSSDDDENAGSLEAKGMSRAEAQVRENEDASLQDDTYTFDSDNTYSDEGIDDFDVSDAGGGMSEFDVDNNDDYV